MLRSIFVLIIVIVGLWFALQSPFYALLLYLWNAYFRPEEWIWWLNLRQFHISLIVGIYVVFRTLLSMPRPQINARTLLILLFLAQAVVGTITSEHTAWSLDFLEDFTKVLIISYIIVVLVTDRQRFRLTLVIIALSLGFECAKQGWVSLIISPGARNDNPIGFLGDNNGVAVGTMMLVPILGALAQTATRQWERLGFRFVLIGVFLRGLTTYSRGGFVAAAVLGVLVLMRSQKKVRTLIGIVAIGVLILVVMPREYWDRINTITTTEEEMDNSTAGRIHFWRVGVNMAIAKPLTGVGLNGFELSYTTYNYDGRFPGMRAAHSAWFGVLGDLGIPGLALFLANLLTALFSCWQVSRLVRGDPSKNELRIFANALITAIVVWSAGTTFLSGQYDEMFWHFVGLSTALYLIATSEVAATQPAVSNTAIVWGQAAAVRAPYAVGAPSASGSRPVRQP